MPRAATKSISTLLLLLFILCFLVYPLGGLLCRAFFVSGRFSLAYFVVLLTTPGTLELFLRSLNLALLVTAISALIALPLAFALSRYVFPLKGFFQFAVLWPMILPPFVGAIGIRRVLARFGPLNLLLMNSGLIDKPLDFLGAAPFLAVAVTEALHLFPVLCLYVASALGRIDSSLEDAASNAGATPWARFRRITWPLILPGCFAGACLVFIGSLTDLGTPLVFDYTALIAVKIFNQVDEMHVNPLGYALVVMLLAATLLVFVLAKALMPQGTAAEGQKGNAPFVPRKLGIVSGLTVSLLLLALLAIAILPHLAVLLTSFAESWFMSVLPFAYTLGHYLEVVNHPLTARSLKNSLFLSFGSTLVCLLFGTMMGYLIARNRGPLGRLLEGLSMVPLAVPGIVLAFAYLGAFADTCFDPRRNPFPLLVFGYAIRRLPFMVRAAAAGFETSSIVLEEAAQSVGAGRSKTFMRITLPLTYPYIMAGGILCFSFAMLEVSESLLLAMEERFYPLSKAMYALLGRPDGPFVAAALGVSGMLVVGLCLLAARRLLGKKFGEVFGV